MVRQQYDSWALAVARRIHRRENPLATILFGSRARGDYREDSSDIDIMLVLHQEPDLEYRDLTREWVEEAACAEYGKAVPVQLVWLSKKQFDEKQKYINHIATRAVSEGKIIVRNPGGLTGNTTTNKKQGTNTTGPITITGACML